MVSESALQDAACFGLSELPPPVLYNILARVSGGDLCRVGKVCKALRDAANDEQLWKELAERTYPANSVKLPPHYCRYKTLCQDGNVEHVVQYLDLGGRLCTWRGNAMNINPHMFYACKLLGLQLAARPNTLRVAFDARGHVDLRAPCASCLAVVSLVQVEGQPAPRLGVLHAAALPSRQLLCDARPGHYKGVLEWSAHDSGLLLEALDGASAKPDQAVLWRREGADVAPWPRHLAFCYANDLARMADHADYHPVPLVTLNSPGELRSALLGALPYVTKGEPEASLAGEGDGAERARWAGQVPAATRELGDAWWVVARPPGAAAAPEFREVNEGLGDWAGEFEAVWGDEEWVDAADDAGGDGGDDGGEEAVWADEEVVFGGAEEEVEQQVLVE